MITSPAIDDVRKSKSAAKGLAARGSGLRLPLRETANGCFSSVVEEAAAIHGDAPALLSDCESLSYRGLARRGNQYARWALAQGLAKEVMLSA